jgi:integrase
MKTEFEVKYAKWAFANKWFVDGREHGKRSRKFFRTKAEAETHCKKKNTEQLNYGIEGAQFPTELRIMAQDSIEKVLELLPEPPEDGSDEHRKRRMSDARKMVVGAVDEYVARWKAEKKSCSAEQLVDELVAAKKARGASDRHVNDLRVRLSKFAGKFDGQSVATISTAEIDDWLGSLPVSPVTRNNFRRLTILAFNFAVKRGYAQSNPAKETDKDREPKTKPGILTVEQAQSLLENAAPQISPYVAIGLFAGLRRAEIERLDWSEIDFESGHIEVTAEKSKSKIANRFIEIQPNLREWLLPHRKLSGNVTPQDRFEFRQLFEQARKDAGIDEWPDNALRHSFASYHVAHFKDAKGLALEMGHADSGMLFNHYRQIVRPKEAARYWSIRPKSTQQATALRDKITRTILDGSSFRRRVAENLAMPVKYSRNDGVFYDPNWQDYCARPLARKRAPKRIV